MPYRSNYVKSGLYHTIMSYNLPHMTSSTTMMFLKQRVRKRWKVLAIVGGLWIWALFPIPFLPLFNAPYDVTSVNITVIIAAVASIPFTLLALFMNSGRRSEEEE